MRLAFMAISSPMMKGRQLWRRGITRKALLSLVDPLATTSAGSSPYNFANLPEAVVGSRLA